MKEKYQKEMLSHVRSHLADHDHRLTPQREAVVKVLMNNPDAHLSAEDIFLKTKELFPDIGLATVYRTLELLENLNIVHRLQYGDNQGRYELNMHNDEHYHHHLICVKCGSISEFNDDLLEDVEQRIEKETGFRITDHSLQFYGYCKYCNGE